MVERGMVTVFDRTDGGWNGATHQVRVLFRAGGRHYVADWVEGFGPGTGSELMVFRSNARGEVRKCRDLAMWRGVGTADIRRCVEEFAATVEKGE